MHVTILEAAVSFNPTCLTCCLRSRQRQTAGVCGMILLTLSQSIAHAKRITLSGLIPHGALCINSNGVALARSCLTGIGRTGFIVVTITVLLTHNRAVWNCRLKFSTAVGLSGQHTSVYVANAHRFSCTINRNILRFPHRHRHVWRWSGPHCFIHFVTIHSSISATISGIRQLRPIISIRRTGC